jgi:transcriptional regulator with XRE-family HTH domain
MNINISLQENKGIINTQLKLIGAQLQRLRKFKGIKQDYVAQELKVSLSYVSKIENGKTPIYLLTFVNYCSIVGISMVEIHHILEGIFKST